MTDIIFFDLGKSSTVWVLAVFISMHVLLTGGNGFLAAHILDQLLERR